MTAPKGSTVSVFGAYDSAEDSPTWRLAHDVGRELAKLGYGIANGGYGGTMLASARGARRGGGATIGVTCELWGRQANECIDRVEHTLDLPGRLDKLIELGDAGFVVLPGGTGTLVELSLVWEMVCKKMIPARPVVCMTSFWQPLVDMIASQRATAAKFVAVAESAGELHRYFPPRRVTWKPCDPERIQ